MDEDHPVIEFGRYWHGLNDGQTPDRSLFKPETVTSLLPWIMVLERLYKGEEDQYFVRLQGTAFTRLTQKSGTGQYLHDFTRGVCYTSRLEAIRGIIEAGQPGFGRATPGKGEEYSVEVGVGAFPFTFNGDGVQVFMIAAPSKIKLWKIF